MAESSQQTTPDNQNDEVIAVVSDHWLRGSMATTGQRVLDVLNEGNTDYLRLANARVFATADLKTPIATLGEVMIPKEKLGVVFIPASNRSDGDLKRHYSKVQTRRTAGFALVCGHAIQGNIHLKCRLNDPIYAMKHALARFFPMTQVNVSMPNGTSMRIAVAIANKQFVDCFHLGETESPQESPPAESKTAQTPPQISVMDDPLIRGLIDAASGHSDTATPKSSERQTLPHGS